MQEVPIATVHLFKELDDKLNELLCALEPDEWNRQTTAPLWKVRDVACHLLDGNLRLLSTMRDGFFTKPDRELSGYHDVVDYLNNLNAEWITATQRLSTAVLIDLLKHTGNQVTEFLPTLNLYDEAPFPVAWAGEEHSSMWFHIAREYTEKWHHQQQIRAATGKEGIMHRKLFYPFVDTLLQGLPFAYRNIIAPSNTLVEVVIETDAGGSWFVSAAEGTWHLEKQSPLASPVAIISIHPQVAWRLFTKGLSPQEAEKLVTIKGERKFALPVLHMISVMA